MVRLMIAVDSYRVSGPAKGLLDFCEHVRGALDPVFVVFQRGRWHMTEFRTECQRRGLRAEVVWERRRYDLAMFARVLRVARAIGPDLVQTHGYKADTVGLFLRRRLRVPWIAFSHGWTDEGIMMRLYRRLDDAIIRRADRVVAVSADRGADLEARGCPAARLRVIHNAVTVPSMQPPDVSEVRRELGLRPASPVIAAIGRLSPEKGHRHFLTAMSEVVRAVPEAQGLIVGEGQEERALRATAEGMGLAGALRFAGYRRDMERIYPAIDLVVLPSVSEGLPNVVLEAMAHARPVVATRVGGVPELVEDGVSGLLVPPAAAPELAQAVVTLLRDPARRQSLGRAGRERVARGFSVERRSQHLLALYQDVLQGPTQ